MEKVFIVEERKEYITSNNTFGVDTCIMSVFSSMEGVIEFLRKTLEDSNSGFNENTLIQITQE